MGKVISFPTPRDKNMLPVEQWEWTDLKATWEGLAKALGPDPAWQIIHQILIKGLQGDTECEK